MVHYLAPGETMKAVATATPEQKAAGMKPWMDWKASMGNKLVEMGAPIMGAVSLRPDGSSTHEMSNVTGYSIIQANDMDEATAILKTHPHLLLREDSSIQIYECIEM